MERLCVSDQVKNSLSRYIQIALIDREIHPSLVEISRRFYHELIGRAIILTHNGTENEVPLDITLGRKTEQVIVKIHRNESQTAILISCVAKGILLPPVFTFNLVNELILDDAGKPVNFHSGQLCRNLLDLRDNS